MAETTQALSETRLPRVTIQFCTQCKWMLRAAYYAQELLSTFSLSLGEVALQPATGGVFIVEITTTTTSTTSTTTASPSSSNPADDNSPTTASIPDTKDAPTQNLKKVVLWDRKIDSGFPETKELKRRVRDVIQPGRDLGHVDRDHRKERGEAAGGGGGGGETGAGVRFDTVIGEEARKKTEEAEEQIEVARRGEELGGQGKASCGGEGGGKCEDCE